MFHRRNSIKVAQASSAKIKPSPAGNKISKSFICLPKTSKTSALSVRQCLLKNIPAKAPT